MIKDTDKNLLLIASPYPQEIQSEIIAFSGELNLKLIPADIDSFASGERFAELYPNQTDRFIENQKEITGAHVHVLMTMDQDPSQFFYDTINTVETLKYYGAKHIHLIMPFAPFGRQDRPFKNRMVSVAGEMFPKHLKYAGVNHVTTFDPHSKAEQAAFTNIFGRKNVHFLSANPIFHDALRRIIPTTDKIIISAPDGADKPEDMAQFQAQDLSTYFHGHDSDFKENGFGIVKTHISANETKAVKAFGNAKGCTVVLRDDMTDTGGTQLNAGDIIKEDGAKTLFTAFTHPIVSGNSLSKLTSDVINDKKNPLDRLFTTNSILGIYEKVKQLPQEQQDKVTIVSTVPLIKQALTMKFN